MFIDLFTYCCFCRVELKKMDEDPSQSGQNLWRPATQAGYQPANQNAQQGYIHPEHNTPPPFQEPQAQVRR